MSWKGNLHAVNTALSTVSASMAQKARDAGREIEVLKQAQIRLNAQKIVLDYENYIEFLQTLHQHKPKPVDWERLAKQPAPSKPDLTAIRTQLAKKQLAEFQPTVTQKMLGTDDRARTRLQEFLDSAIKLEKLELKAKVERYKSDRANWKSLVTLAQAVMRHDRESYLPAVERFPIFEPILGLGSRITLSTESPFSIRAELTVNGKDIIPNEKYALSSSGELFSNPMSKTEYQDLYLDYVCSALIRIARELFAILPIEDVTVTAFDEVLDRGTGNCQQHAIVSSKLDRERFESLNFDLMDPSDTLNRFQTNMDFKPRLGFGAVEVLG